jgi:hypothetical protein
MGLPAAAAAADCHKTENGCWGGKKNSLQCCNLLMIGAREREREREREGDRAELVCECKHNCKLQIAKCEMRAIYNILAVSCCKMLNGVFSQYVSMATTMPRALFFVFFFWFYIFWRGFLRLLLERFFSIFHFRSIKDGD